MTDEPVKTAIQTKYEQQWTDDLTANRARQGELTRELEQLKADEAWLLKQLEGVPGTAPPAAAEEPPAPSKDQDTGPAETAVAVPRPRQDISAKAATKKTAEAKKAQARKPSAKKTATMGTAGSATSKKASKPAGPPLHELLLGMLLKSPNEPRLAKEVHTQLAEEYPKRATTVQTVRNSLERLVALGRATRSRQQRSVMYTADTEADAASGKGGTEEQAPANGTDAKASAGA